MVFGNDSQFRQTGRALQLFLGTTHADAKGRLLQANMFLRRQLLPFGLSTHLDGAIVESRLGQQRYHRSIGIGHAQRRSQLLAHNALAVNNRGKAEVDLLQLQFITGNVAM